MEVGSFAFVKYDNDKVYGGEIVEVRSFDPNHEHETERVMFKVRTLTGYRSLYLHKCKTVELTNPHA